MSASFRTYCLLIVSTFSLCLWGQESVPKEEKALTVAERNALQGFNDTIDRLADDFVTVSLVVADPGPILYAAFGHAMLHLQCPAFNLDYIFTYESEGIQGNWGRFLKGDLKMGMFAVKPEDIFESYRIDGRGVKEYKMNLSPQQKQELWRVMDELVTKGSNQPYDYYNHGCAISVVHVVKKALHGTSIQYGEWPNRFDGTLRELGFRCVTQSHYLWNRFALMTLAGSHIDNQHISREKKLIVPADLAEIWQNATINGQPLLEKEPQWIVSDTLHKENPWCTPLLVCIILFILSLCSFATYYTRKKTWHTIGILIDDGILVISTFIGAIITYTVVLSTLPCTAWNWLIIPFNILPALAWHWRRYWALPYAVIILIWSIVMTGEWIGGHILVEWAHILLALSFCLVLVRQHWRAKA